MSSTSNKIKSARERKEQQNIANMQHKMEELELHLARQKNASAKRHSFHLSRTQRASRMSSRGNSKPTKSTNNNLNVSSSGSSSGSSYGSSSGSSYGSSSGSSSGSRKRWNKPLTIIPIITHSHESHLNESNSHESHLNTSPRSSQKNLNIPNSANTRKRTRKRWVKPVSTKSVKDNIVRNNNHNNHKNHNNSRKSSDKNIYTTRINEV